MDLPDKQSRLVAPLPAEEATQKTPQPATSDKLPRSLLWSFVLLLFVFGVPLYQLAQFALHSDLYSYILLMPFVSGYLIWQQRTIPSGNERRLVGPGVLLVIAGILTWGGCLWSLRAGWKPAVEDYLALTTAAFLISFAGVCCLNLNRNVLRAVGFPLSMLVFMVPIPLAVLDGIEIFLQYGSAYVTHGMLTLAGTPFIREGLIFHLSDISIRVAPECSGIHSTWILLITSLLAGHLFLRSPWKRTAFTLFVVPLALLRNGFRIFTLCELCVHIGPQMIDHWIHHKGGPIFFALSLIPFFILLLFLQKSDRVKKKDPSPSGL